MDLLIAFVVFLLFMVVCLTTGASMLIALAIGMVCFSAVALKRGFPLEDVLRMILSSTRRSFIVLRVLLLIGLVTALWRTSGTIAFFVYYGVQLITPHFFVLIAFVLSAVLPDSEFHDINFFCVDNSIDLQIGVFVQLGEYYEAYG